MMAWHGMAGSGTGGAWLDVSSCSVFLDLPTFPGHEATVCLCFGVAKPGWLLPATIAWLVDIYALAVRTWLIFRDLALRTFTLIPIVNSSGQFPFLVLMLSCYQLYRQIYRATKLSSLFTTSILNYIFFFNC